MASGQIDEPATDESLALFVETGPNVEHGEPLVILVRCKELDHIRRARVRNEHQEQSEQSDIPGQKEQRADALCSYLGNGPAIAPHVNHKMLPIRHFLKQRIGRHGAQNVTILKDGGEVLFRVQQLKAGDDDLVGFHEHRFGFDIRRKKVAVKKEEPVQEQH